MSVISPEIVDMLKKQKMNEIKIAKNLKNTKAEALLKYVLEALALDSKKHALLYDALLKTAKGFRFFSEKDKQEALAEIGRHIEAEKAMLTETLALVESISDPRLKTVIDHIAEDEKRHHTLLSKVVNALDSMELEIDQVYYDWIVGL